MKVGLRKKFLYTISVMSISLAAFLVAPSSTFAAVAFGSSTPIIANASFTDPWHFLAAGDVEHNGTLDFVGEDTNYFLAVTRNATNSPTFVSQTQIASTSYGFYGLQLVDMDGDGDLDAVTAGPNGISTSPNGVYAWSATSSSFDAIRTTYSLKSVAFYGTSLVTGDFTSDGKPDVIWFSNIGAYLGINNTTATDTINFSSIAAIPGMSTAYGNNGIYASAVGDFNGDGHLDFISTDNTTGGGYVLGLGDGAGNFTVSSSSIVDSEHPGGVAVGDFNKDGKSDFVLTRYVSGTFASQAIIYTRNLSNNGFATTTLTIPTNGVAYPTVSDVNGDGYPDITLLVGSNAYIYLNNGDGTFPSSPSYTVALSGSPSQLLYADMNGDGKPDLVAAGSGFLSYYPQIDTTVPTISAAALGITAHSVTLDWINNVNASALVRFGLTSSYASTTPEVDLSPRLTGHAVTLSNLISCTTYHYQLQDTSAYAITATSSDATFMTLGCGGGATFITGTSSPITAGSGGTTTLTQATSSLAVTMPVNSTATTSSFMIQINALNGTGTLGTPSSSLQNVGNDAYDVKAIIDASTTLDSFNAPVTIVMHYSASDIVGLIESSLTVYHYHGGAWIPLTGCTVNTTAKTVTCTTPSFSTFALFGTPVTPAANTISSTGGGTSGGISIPARVANLLAMGNTATAESLMQQYPQFFAATSTPITTYNPGGPMISASSTSFTRSLTLGSTGADVKVLQQFLNAHGFTVAKTGAGSLGNETTYFGKATRAALSAYQKAKEISPASGYFGPVTRSHISS